MGYDFKFIDEDCKNHIEAMDRFKRRSFFHEHRLPSYLSYIFSQSYEALENRLILPACTGFLNGIEASLRVVIEEYSTRNLVLDLDPKILLNNRLLNDARKIGLPVELLAFPEEDDFLEKITSTSKPVKYAEIVRLRHNFCHGNVMEFINKDLGQGYYFFTPECTLPIAFNLLEISRRWVPQLGEFRKSYIDD